MQIYFHQLEIKRNFLLWLLLFCELYSTEQSKSKSTKLASCSKKMQHAGAAVSNRATICMQMNTLRVIQRVANREY